MRKSDLKSLAAGMACIAAGGWGCLSMQSQSTLDGASATNNTQSSQPYVEAYVEYPGPQQKWAGPSSFTLHVAAKDDGAAIITMTPEMLTGDAPEQTGPSVTQRVPAASGLSNTIAAHPQIRAANMTGIQAREHLAHLVVALQGTQAPFRGCMSPVRVRMVRADGAILERQGCRSELGWSRAVSEMVSTFIEASVRSAEPKMVGTEASHEPASTAARSVAGETVHR